jgi:hypothetical protein
MTQGLKSVLGDGVKYYGGRLMETWNDPIIRNHVMADSLTLGIPAVGLLAMQGDNTGEKVGGALGGLAGLGIETAAMGYADKFKDEMKEATMMQKAKRRGGMVLAGIAPILTEMIGSGIGGALSGSEQQGGHQ